MNIKGNLIENKRNWTTYSLSKDAIYCIPCLLLSDNILRGKNKRPNQGNTFTCEGFSNWKKETERIKKHENSKAHVDVKVAHVLFESGLHVTNLLNKQSEDLENQRKKDVVKNREVLGRIIDVILLLGKQGSAYRGRNERLSLDDAINNGNFLENLKLLAKYDVRIRDHLKKFVFVQKSKKNKKNIKVRKGRGSKILFLSNRSQEKLIRIIGNQITKSVAKKMCESIAWSLIVDTTPDITSKEQVSICIRIVSKKGEVSEHLLDCVEAQKTTASALLEIIIKAFEEKGITCEKLVAQTYDGASNMSGKYRGLQAKIKDKFGKHIIYVHCYAHILNLVLKDTVSRY